jgi:WD40 repeat protein
VAFSPDGKLLATFDNRGNIKVADWASDRTLTNLTARSPRRRPIGVVVFSPEGNRLAIGEDYGLVQILDLRTGTVMPLQTQSSEGVNALVFSANARLLAAGVGNAVHLWDADSGESRGQLTNHTDEVRALAFTPDGLQLASASLDETIRIWSVADHTELQCLRCPGNGVIALGWLSDGRTLVTAGWGGWVRLWDATASSRPLTHTNWAVAFGFDSQKEIETPPHFAPETPDPRAARRLGFAFTPDSRSFITTDRYGSLALWDAGSVRVTENLPALGSNHWGVALSPDGRWLAAGNTSGKLTIWDWTARRAVTNFTVPCEYSGKLHFSRSGNFLFAVVFNNEWVARTRIWHTGDWAEIALTGNPFADLWSVDLSPDDRLLATGYADGLVKLFRFPSGQHETTFNNHQGRVTGLIFSLDGRSLISSSTDTNVKLRDLFAPEKLAGMRGHLGQVCSVALSPDGRRAVTGGERPRDAVKLWDLVARREVLTLRVEGHYFHHVGFSPDGSTLAAVTLDGIAHLWRAPTWEEIEAAEKRQRAP